MNISLNFSFRYPEAGSAVAKVFNKNLQLELKCKKNGEKKVSNSSWGMRFNLNIKALKN